MDSAPTITAPRLLDICPACGYSLAGSPDEGVCPECGQAYDQRAAVIYGNMTGAFDWRAAILIALAVLVPMALTSRSQLWPIWGGVFLLALWLSVWIARNAHKPTLFKSTLRVVANELGLLQEQVPGSTPMHLLSGAMDLIALIFLAFAFHPGVLVGAWLVPLIFQVNRLRKLLRRRRRRRELGRELTLSERIQLEGTPAARVRSIKLTRDKRGHQHLEIKSIRKGKPLQPDIPTVYIQPIEVDDRLHHILAQMHDWYRVPRDPPAPPA